MKHRFHAASRRRPRGFTLVELLVSMTAGLIVALAIVALSKAATSTFHEETRIASAQMQLRSAVDRLRSDLQRASFMSTANISADPLAAHIPGAANNGPTGLNGTMKSTADLSLQNLAGVRLFTLTSGSGNHLPTALSLSSVNGVSPQAIELAGNFTSVEQFPVGSATHGQILDSSQEGGVCGGQRVHLNLQNSPSIWRAAGMYGTGGDGGTGPTKATLDANLQAVFSPVAGSQFIVRYYDPATQMSQFVATCPNTPAAFDSTLTDVWVDIDPNTPIKPASMFTASGSGATTETGVKGGTINPVQIVRWEIVPALIGGGDGGDGTKYDLTRSWLDVGGNTVGSPELIAEYAVDLAFGFTVDTSTNSTGAQASETVFGIDDVTNNALWAKDVTTMGPANGTANPGPQLIRAVRARISTRSAEADRDAPLDAGANYLYRYCVAPVANDAGASCTPGSVGWARSRTVVTEVALPNQARYWYQ